MQRIDTVSIATLRDCMQTTFEDGPRRDRRLWVGDLRLQALTNYHSFKSNDVVRRCLYLFASLPRADGLVARYGGVHIVDYAVSFNVTLQDYVEATGDVETGRDLWPAAKRQLEIVGRDVNAEGLFVETKNMWIFIDWSESLDKNAAIQGVLIYAYRKTLALSRRIGRDSEVAAYAERIERMVAAVRDHYWDASKRVFLSGPNRQVSWSSQAWMAIAGVSSRRESADAMRAASGRKRAPYGDIHINSYCHAWSCTPSYLLRSGLL